VKGNRRFGGTGRLYFQCWSISQARNQHESGNKIESVRFSETAVGFKRTRQRYILEDRTLHNHRYENLKSSKDYGHKSRKLIWTGHVGSIRHKICVLIFCRKFWKETLGRPKHTRRWEDSIEMNLGGIRYKDLGCLRKGCRVVVKAVVKLHFPLKAGNSPRSNCFFYVCYLTSCQYREYTALDDGMTGGWIGKSLGGMCRVPLELLAQHLCDRSEENNGKPQLQ
jgi:hypothetical protein